MKKQLMVFVIVVACLHIISCAKKSADDWYYSALSKCKDNDYRGAIADFTEAIEVKPDCAYAYRFRGIVRERLLDYQGAIADYTKTIELNPVDIWAYSCRGLARFDLADIEKVAEVLRFHNRLHVKVVGPEEGFANAYGWRGIMKVTIADNQGAIADYTKAIKLWPDGASFYHSRGDAYLNLKQKEKALADYLRAIELGSDVSQEDLDDCK